MATPAARLWITTYKVIAWVVNTHNHFDHSSGLRTFVAEGAGEPLTLFGSDYPTPDGTCVRDYIHVADLADAHLRALEATAPDDDRTAGALVCNLGSGGGFSVREVVAAAESVVGRPIPHTTGPRRAADPRRLSGAGGIRAGLASAALVARGDDRVGLGVAKTSPGRLFHLNRPRLHVDRAGIHPISNAAEHHFFRRRSSEIGN